MSDDQLHLIRLLLISQNLSDSVAQLENYLFILTLLRSLHNAETQLQKATRFDQLTQLANRFQYEEDLTRELARAKRYNRKLAVIFIDIDNFSKINEKFGYEYSDTLLKSITARLRLVVRTEDLISRVDANKFSVIATEIDNAHEAGLVAHRIVDSMNKPFVIGEHTAVVHANIGIAIFPDTGTEPVTLNKNAEMALYDSKSTGRSSYKFFTLDMQQKHAHHLELESELHFALERKEFFLVYQPRFDLITKNMVGMEALMRWQHPNRGLISPLDFIPIAEETGLIVPMGQWVLNTACQQFAKWRAQTKDLNIVLAVNVAPQQFQGKGFVKIVMHALDENNIPADLLELEITETAVTGYVGRIESALFQLRNLGVKFSIDDFGTGYSSLTRLKELPIHAIKIDRNFVGDIDLGASDNTIVKSTIELAKGMGLNAIAEGVETESQLNFLIANNCPQAQGFYYSMPLVVEEMTQFIKEHFNVLKHS